VWVVMGRKKKVKRGAAGSFKKRKKIEADGKSTPRRRRISGARQTPEEMEKTALSKRKK